MTKPPPITITPNGFSAHKPMGSDPPPVELHMLAKLPTFQMFMESREGKPPGMDSDRFAYERAMSAGTELIAEYEAWHEAQGKWPRETPYGVLK